MNLPLPLVSCLCVTRARVRMLKRAVRCFAAQTYGRKELIIVYHADDRETTTLVASLAHDSSIRGVEAQAAGTQTLGELRNLSVSQARGEYVAQWDDDDWYAPERLEAQMNALRQHPDAQACVLRRWLLHDHLTGTAYVSGRRPWEGSLVARRAALPSYPLLARAEDTQVIAAIARSGHLVLLDRPELYIYCYHGSNTWDRAHFERNLVAHATRLAGPATAWVRERVGSNNEKLQ